MRRWGSKNIVFHAALCVRTGPLRAGRIAGACRDDQLLKFQPMLVCHLRNTNQRRAQIARHVYRQGFDRRDMQNPATLCFYLSVPPDAIPDR